MEVNFLNEDLSLIINHSYNPIVITDNSLEGPHHPKILYVNKAFEQLTGYKREEVIGKTPRILQGKRTNRSILVQLKNRLAQGEFFEGSGINYKKNREEYYVEWNVSPIKDESGQVKYFLSIQKDISDKIHREQQELIFKLAMEQSKDHIALIDHAGNYLYINEAYSLRTGYTTKELIGQNPSLLKSGKHTDEFYKTLWMKLFNKEAIEATFINKKKSGVLYFDDQTITPIVVNDMIISFLVIGKDVSDYLEKEHILKDLAFKDSLTGVFNRNGLDNYFENIKDALLNKEEYTMILFDIDHFKKINDTYGHIIGDQVLKSLSSLVKSKLRSHDKLFRWGGEEFVIIVKTSLENSAKLAEKLRGMIEKRLFCENISLTCSFGVSAIDKIDLQKVFEQADVALYKAKNGGRNRVEVCTH